MDKELVSLRIDEVIKHIDITENDLKDIQLEHFSGTSLLTRATAFSVEQICEHISKIRKYFEKDHPEIPWNKIYDTRIVIAHMYISIDCEIIYEIVKNDLPLLKEQLLVIKANL